MRTSIDLPDSLYRQLKAFAALQGVPMKDVLIRMVERGLKSPDLSSERAPARKALPTLGGTCSLPPEALSNAGLFELLDGIADSGPGQRAPG
jgi:hypothetical protein